MKRFDSAYPRQTIKANSYAILHEQEEEGQCRWIFKKDAEEKEKSYQEQINKIKEQYQEKYEIQMKKYKEQLEKEKQRLLEIKKKETKT